MTNGRLQLRSSPAHTLLPDKAPFLALIGVLPSHCLGSQSFTCSLVCYSVTVIQLQKAQTVFFMVNSLDDVFLGLKVEKS